MKPAHNPSSRCVNETFTKTTRFTSAEAILINSGTYDVAEHSRKTKVKPSVTGRSSDSAQRLKPTARRRSERLQTRRKPSPRDVSVKWRKAKAAPAGSPLGTVGDVSNLFPGALRSLPPQPHRLSPAVTDAGVLIG